MDNFDIKKYLIENKLTTNSQQLDEIDWKGLTAGVILSLTGLTGAQAQTSQPTSTQTTQTVSKPMFGTPEQRAAAAEKRKQNRITIFNNFIKGAYNTRECVEEIDDEEYAKGCSNTDNDGSPYINGTSTELPEFLYRELENGTKVKIDLKKYQRIIKKRGKAEDVGLEGMQDPSFKPTQCGISRAHAKQDKEEFKKK